MFRTRHPTRAHDLEADSLHDDSSPTRRIKPGTLRQLAASPRLATICFSRDEDIDLTLSTQASEWSAVGVRGAVIATYRSGMHELVHVRTLTRSQLRREVQADQEEHMAEYPWSDHSADLEDMFDVGEQLHWEHAVAYDGVYVTAAMMDDAFGVEPGGWRWTAGGRDKHLPEQVQRSLEEAIRRLVPESRYRRGATRELLDLQLGHSATSSPGLERAAR